jgi:hypothetical protein
VNSLFKHTGETRQSQMVFRPVDARGLNNNTSPVSYKRMYPSTATVSGYRPLAYHNWVDIGNFNPTDTRDLDLLRVDQSLGGALAGGASGRYYRLKVSDLDWSGNPPSGNGTSGASTAHKGYAVRLVDTLGAECTNQCGGATLSGLNDLCIFTPVVNNTGSQASFDIPIFQLGKEYAGKTITIQVFDPGDVSGSAYMQIIQPIHNGSATEVIANAPAAPAAVDLGSSLTGNNGTGAITPQGTPTQAYIQSAAAGSGVLWNGVWVQFQVAVPTNWDPIQANYWKLRYIVDPGTVAADTVTLRVAFNGTPVHLLP